jgi:low temperature requirement protein LtrA
MRRLQRRQVAAEEQRATSLELFYDLVFVFAITQVSHLLLEHLTWAGAGQALLVLLVVWWSWNYTTWVTNELDPESLSVRLLMIALMLAGLLMAIAIPQAFGEHALLFVGSYVAIQVGATLSSRSRQRSPGQSSGSGPVGSLRGSWRRACSGSQAHSWMSRRASRSG